VFHHEPISWNLDKLDETHERIITVMSWLNKDLPKLVEKIDRVLEVLKKVKDKNI